MSLDKVIGSYIAGMALPVSAMSGSTLSSRQMEDLSGLPRHENIILGQISSEHDKGLSEVRAGAFDKALKWFGRAHHIMETGLETEESRLVGTSFHLAAVAYLDFHLARYQEAEQGLHEAMVACKRLAEEHGHRHAAARRVHLARNLVRVSWMHGKHGDAVAMAYQLLTYLWADKTVWPFGAASDVRVELKPSEEEALWLSDELLSELPAMVDSARKRKRGFPPEPMGLAAALGHCPVRERVRATYALCQSATDRREHELDTALSTFFALGRGSFVLTWRKVEWLSRQCGVALPLVE
ncbi:hypothetical protein [Archangium violaceum]|uniref:MalT-like TPR region domain-containing protein n=1 Tax=Archangium violaceum Cb vi76 TaxID=1406225 RepID=A0A084SKD1_9BACT|nr:hypothetical protein [Archangium violaceum]KFA88916.1 hypothetical protein Q664_38315 [Archangium violaceum Cb vi76]